MKSDAAPRARRRRRAWYLALVVGCATGGLACRGTSLAFGPDAPSALSNGDALLRALEHRFTNVLRTPKFAHARMQMARYALAPSKLENDSALWTTRTGSTGATRELQVDASMVGERYTFIARPQVPMPAHVGDSRHTIRLSPLVGNDYVWVTDVEHHVGAMPPSRAGTLFSTLLEAAERSDGAIRSDYRSAFAKTAQAWGRLFSLDTIKPFAEADGSTRVELHFSLDPLRLGNTMPSLARYVERYVSEGRSRVQLTDRTGAIWFDVVADHSNAFVVRFRSKRGALQPIEGVARPLPDTLGIRVDARTRFGFFTVGVKGMKGDFVQLRTPAERGWVMHFTTEPEWQLPLFTHSVLKSPLRRPFEGQGITFRLGLRTGPAGQTLLARSLVVTVRESAIMRFLGNLGFTAASDFAGAVEVEENRFLAEGFAAMRADLAALLRKE